MSEYRASYREALLVKRNSCTHHNIPESDFTDMNIENILVEQYLSGLKILPINVPKPMATTTLSKIAASFSCGRFRKVVGKKCWMSLNMAIRNAVTISGFVMYLKQFKL